MEIQRVSCVAPGGLEHKLLEDTTFHGYNIKKGTTWERNQETNCTLIIIFRLSGTVFYYSIYSFHNDPKYWGDPEVFRPERFLSPDGNSTIKKDQFIPFGFGKRVCMGESLAKAELFIFSAMIIQSLKISLPKKQKKPNPQEYHSGITKTPSPFHVHIEARE